MLSLIKSEFKKNGNGTQIYLSLAVLLAIQIILMMIIINSFNLTGFGDLKTTEFRKSLLSFAGFSYLFTIFVGAIVGYYFISKEYLNNTWELLILGIKNKFQVVLSKFIVGIIIYIFYQILSLTCFTFLVKTYFGDTIEWSFFMLILVANLSCNMLFYVIQLSAHFLISNSMTAITFSLLLVILPIFLGNNFLFVNFIPLISISYIVNSMAFSMVHFILLSMWTVLVSGFTVIGVSEYFRL